MVIEAEHVRKGYGDRLLIEDLSFTLPRAGIVGVIGPNGAGKTTLFRMLTGGEKPDDGIDAASDRPCNSPTSTRAATSSTPSRTVYEEITDGRDDLVVGGREMNGRAYVASFNFKGSDQQKKVGVLSGGERNRVHLAKVLKTGGNVLLLDEPTNDLDVDTLRALEDGARGVRRLCRRHQPRPLVPRPHRHPHPRLRGRQPGPLVRGQLQRVRGVPPQGARRRGRPAASHPYKPLAR